MLTIEFDLSIAKSNSLVKSIMASTTTANGFGLKPNKPLFYNDDDSSSSEDNEDFRYIILGSMTIKNI